MDGGGSNMQVISLMGITVRSLAFRVISDSVLPLPQGQERGSPSVSPYHRN